MRAVKFIVALSLLIAVGVWIFASSHGGSKGSGGGSNDAINLRTDPRAVTPQVKSLQDADWGRFRRAFPFHMQAIAVSKPYPDQSRTLIVSEPPPDVTLDGLKAVDAGALTTCEIKQHTVGSDGWARDAVTAETKLGPPGAEPRRGNDGVPGPVRAGAGPGHRRVGIVQHVVVQFDSASHLTKLRHADW